MVEEARKKFRVGKGSMRLPRHATKADLVESRLVTWAICNLAAATCLAPSAWIREVTPIPKDAGVVADVERLRPVATTDDLESFSEALWFSHPPAATAALGGVALPRPPQEGLATFASALALSSASIGVGPL